MTAPSYLLDLLGVLIKSNASSVATTKTLNFVAPLSATYNAGTGEVDVESEAIEADGGDVSFDPTGTVFSSTDMQALGQEISADISLTAQSVAANPTGATAKLASLAMSAQSILARAAGNVASLAVAANALLARAGSGDLASLAVSADSVLGRVGSGDLGSQSFGVFARQGYANPTASELAALTHVGAVRRFALATAGTYTVPPQSDVAWIDMSVIHVEVGPTSAQLTITPGSGVTVASGDGDGMVLYAGMSATLRRISLNSWQLVTSRRIKGLNSTGVSVIHSPPGDTALVNGLSPRAAQGSASLADGATHTAFVEIPSTNNTVTKVRWFWYVGVAGTPAYAAGFYDVVYFRDSSSSLLYVLADGFASGSSAPLGWAIAATTDTGSGGQFRLTLTNSTGASRKAYARPMVSTEILS